MGLYHIYIYILFLTHIIEELLVKRTSNETTKVIISIYLHTYIFARVDRFCESNESMSLSDASESNAFYSVTPLSLRRIESIFGMEVL